MSAILPEDRKQRQKVILKLARGETATYEVRGKTYVAKPVSNKDLKPKK